MFCILLLSLSLLNYYVKSETTNAVGYISQMIPLARNARYDSNTDECCGISEASYWQELSLHKQAPTLTITFLLVIYAPIHMVEAFALRSNCFIQTVSYWTDIAHNILCLHYNSSTCAQNIFFIINFIFQQFKLIKCYR